MLKILFCAGVSGLCLASLAHAQDDTSLFGRDRNIPVLDRPHPEYDALGIRTGGFLIVPKLETTLLYDDNVFVTTNNPTSDEIFEAKGLVQARSQWSSNALNGSLTIAQDQYISQSSQSNTTYSAEADGRLDILRGSNLSGQLQYDHGAEARSSETAENVSVNPIEFNHGLADGKAVWSQGHVQALSDVSINTFTYFDGRDPNGNSVDETYRNHTEYKVRGELDYAISPATAFYVSATGLNFVYDNNADKKLVNRDSNGYETDLGTDFEIGALVRARVEVGYRQENFSYASAPKLSGIDYHAKIQYFPTQLTTLTFSADRLLEDSGILSAPAYLANDLSLEVDHELLRNLVISAIGNYTLADVIGLQRTDNRPGATIRANYLLNHGVGLNIGYSFLQQNSTGLNRGANFTINQLRVGAVLQY